MSKGFKVKNSLVVTPSTTPTSEAGELRVDSTDSNKLKYNNGSVETEVLTSTLAQNKILVGDVSGVAQPVTMSGDVTLASDGTTTIADGAISDEKIDVGAAIDVSKLSSGIVTNTEFDYLSGLSDNIQAQLNAAQPAITGAASTITSSNLTASRALVSNASGKVAASTITSAELGHLSGVTSPIQTQLDGKITSTEKGAANGVAPLNSSQKIDSAYLPSFQDDVVEFANLAAFPATGEAGVIYVAINTNKIYRWSGSTYIEISPSPGSTDSVTEGAVNLYFTNARADARADARIAASSIDALSDVNTSGVATGDVLRWNGTNWVPVSGAAKNSIASTFTASRAVVTDSSGYLAPHGSTTATDIANLAGTTGNVQTQIDSANTAITAKVAKSGDTMSGPLTVSAATTYGLQFSNSADMGSGVKVTNSNTGSSTNTFLLLETGDSGGYFAAYTTGFSNPSLQGRFVMGTSAGSGLSVMAGLGQDVILGANSSEIARVTSTGLNMNSQKVYNVATPTATTDAANKSYVDGKLVTRTVLSTPGSGTYTRPAAARALKVTVVGGGGGGGGTAGGSNAGAGGGGGAGGWTEIFITSPSSSYSYTVGSAGSAGTAGNNAGGNGGASSFGTTTANGGTGGSGFAGGSTGIVFSTSAASGGSTSGGSYGNTGAVGQQGLILATGQARGGEGGHCLPFGSGGPGGQGTQAGSAGRGYGAGGGGGCVVNSGAAQAGGAGAAGLIIIEEYY